MEKEIMKITVSFKRHEKQLYDRARIFSSPTGYIKDLIKKDLEQQKAPQNEGHR